MNDLELYTRSWGATAVPFGPLSDTQWVEIPSQQRALTLLNQTAALRGVMLLSGGNGVGKSTLAGRWVRQLESRLFTPVNLTQATLSSSGLLASLARGLGKQPSMRRERNLDELSSYLSEHERQTLVIVMDDAQNSTHSTLEEMRLLLGLNLPSQPTFALILLGDEYLLGATPVAQSSGALFPAQRSSPAQSLDFGGDPDLSDHRVASRGHSPHQSLRTSRRRPVGARHGGRAAQRLPFGASRLAGSGPGRGPGNWRSDHATGHGAGAGVARLDSPQLMIERIQQAHALYCRLTGQCVSLRFDRERLWYELFQAGFNEADLQKVIRYLQREIREGRRNVGALKLSNLLQLDRFEEDLNISRVRLYPPKAPTIASSIAAPPPTPSSQEEDQAARQRALQILARFRAEQS